LSGGRDVEEGEFAAEFNRNTCRWRLVGGAEDVFRSKERQAILSTLGSATEPMSIPDIMAATERTDRCATKALLHKMRTAGEVVSEKGRYSLSPADLSNAVDRVDRDNFLTPPSLQSIDDADGFPPEGRSTAAVNGRSTVNGGVDRALTTENSAKCLKDSQNSRSGQQVNAVNAIQHGASRARLRARAAALATDQA
jgi:hypothetical protein